LLMQNDINTYGYTQWFYFRVMNTTAGQTVKFNILNYTKPDSMFNYGMKVSVHSEKRASQEKVGWTRECTNIMYFQNGIRKDVTYYSRQYYSLTFTYKFEHDADSVCFAYSVPYSYTDLRNDLAEIECDEQRSANFNRKLLCKTLNGEDCEVLTITSRDKIENYSQRKAVLLTARVHPGETVSSWMMRGLIYFLTDAEDAEAKLLRDNFIFKIVPMLNPDGVINGNYRCSLAGCDLNRRWKTPSKLLHPTIYHVKKLAKQLHLERTLALFCDLHGHSRKNNVFMYGCNKFEDPQWTRIFPFMLSKLNPYFSFENSRFGIQKDKE
jgi:cytosolic carboxypeptidase protein 2/3